VVESSEDRATWRPGQRVARKTNGEVGTVTETDGAIKVKWDSGRTSYFRHNETANVQLDRVTKA
jgi:hypothetical protein